MATPVATRAAAEADLRRLFLVLFWDDRALGEALSLGHFAELDEDEVVAAREVELLGTWGRVREDWLALRVARRQVNGGFFQALTAWAPGRRFLVQRLEEQWSELGTEAAPPRPVVLFDPDLRADHEELARTLGGLLFEHDEIRAQAARAGLPWQHVAQGKTALETWRAVLWVASCRDRWPALRTQVIERVPAAEADLPLEL